MPRLNFAEPKPQSDIRSVRLERLAAEECGLAGDDLLRLSAVGLATLEVAHDLGNLLQVASSAVRIIDRSLTGATRTRLDPVIAGALSSMERATALSRRILETGRPQTPVENVVYLDTLLTELRDEICLTTGPDVQVVLKLGDFIPAITCPRVDLENVILNLVANARDAMMAEGQLILSVSREQPLGGTPSERSEVVLRVSDTGCGMPVSVASLAFNPFFTTKPGHRGTGLGLAMVRTFATRLGGTAEIASTLGEGTTIILRMPSSRG